MHRRHGPSSQRDSKILLWLNSFVIGGSPPPLFRSSPESIASNGMISFYRLASGNFDVHVLRSAAFCPRLFSLAEGGAHSPFISPSDSQTLVQIFIRVLALIHRQQLAAAPDCICIQRALQSRFIATDGCRGSSWGPRPSRPQCGSQVARRTGRARHWAPRSCLFLLPVPAFWGSHAVGCLIPRASDIQSLRVTIYEPRRMVQ